MKKNISFFAGALMIFAVLLSGCESTKIKSHSPSTDRSNEAASFDRKNEETFNPVTNQYEKQPPYGPRSNKSSSGI